MKKFEVQEETKFNVKIHDITINGFNFTIDSSIKLHDRFNIDDIGNLISVLTELKRILEDN
ncbi:hypothetical protein D3C81_2336630 [compost metagenome]